MKTNIHFDWKKIGPHVVALVLFFLWSFLYFAPVVLGEKDMGQGDHLIFRCPEDGGRKEASCESA